MISYKFIFRVVQWTLKLFHFHSFHFIPFSVIETKQGNVTTVEAIVKPQPGLHLLMKKPDNGACYLCSTGVDLKHTVSQCFFLNIFNTVYSVNRRLR